MWSPLGKFLVAMGGFLVLVGLLLLVWDRIPGLGWLGRLPGDLRFGGKGFVVYVPLATSLLLSLLLTLLLNLFLKR
jgi:hypothetical protein